MRRTLSLFVALCLTFAGAGGLVYLAFFASGWKGWMIIGSAFIGGLGAIWVWSDLIETPDEKS